MLTRGATTIIATTITASTIIATNIISTTSIAKTIAIIANTVIIAITAAMLHNN